MSFADGPCTAFADARIVGQGHLREVALVCKRLLDQASADTAPPSLLLFADATSEVVELDWRGTEREFAARLLALEQASAAAPTPDTPTMPDSNADTRRGPGRPRLGVTAREVTLLPRHWDWLATQPGGASVALRKLVEVALRTSQTKDRVRRAAEVGYRFMRTMAEHQPQAMPGFDEASRALFAGDQGGFETAITGWPADVQTHLRRLLSDAFWWF